MKKIIIGIITIIVLGGGYWLISPFFITKKVSEVSPLATTNTDTSSQTTPVATTPKLIASGTFSGFDTLHNGSGSASLIQTADGFILRFEDDFNVTNGPDLYVGFGKDGTYIKGSELSKLKGTIGSQNYALPADFDLSTSNEVWIWCKAFSVPFAKAPLKQ